MTTAQDFFVPDFTPAPGSEALLVKGQDRREAQFDRLLAEGVAPGVTIADKGGDFPVVVTPSGKQVSFDNIGSGSWPVLGTEWRKAPECWDVHLNERDWNNPVTVISIPAGYCGECPAALWEVLVKCDKALAE